MYSPIFMRIWKKKFDRGEIMTENMFMLLINAFTLLLILLLQILIPSISRRNILLGVKIPRDKMQTDEVKKIVKGFKRENLIIGIIGIILLTFILDQYNSITLLTLSPILYLILLFLIYMRWNKKLKELKSKESWSKLAENLIVVDTKFSRDRAKGMGISRYWYLIPLFMIFANTVLSLVVYPSLPDKLPTHWDFQGNVDGYMNKSVLVALMMPIFQLIMAIIIYLSNYFIVKSKQQIDGKDPEVSLKKNIIFRKVWSIYFLITLVLLEVLFTVSNMMILGLINNGALQINLTFIISGIMILGSIIISVKLGQGGDKIKIDEKENTNTSYDIDDDNLWKLGNSIYYNPEDPSIIIEKRIGVGWTVNAGRPLGMFFLIIPFIIIAITLFLVK